MNTYKNIFIFSFFLALLSGCASHPPLTPVKVTKPGDSSLSCQQLHTQINALEKQVLQAIEAHQQRDNARFTYAAALDAALTVLSKGRAGAASHTERSPLASMSGQEKQAIFSLRARHEHLMSLAKQKQCAFAQQGRY